MKQVKESLLMIPLVLVILLHNTPAQANVERITSDPVLQQMAAHCQLQNYEVMDGGVLGNLGSARVFVAPTSRIPDWSRLYWVKVRVLSEKYGCFMRSRQDKDNVTKFTCKDNRQIVFWRAKGEHWIRFYSRQYDAGGHEIAVRNRQIYRLR